MIRTPALCLAGVLLALLSTPALAARLVGSVTSSPAAPIVNATVVLDGPTGPVATTHTSATGTFVLEAPPGEYTLRVVAEGFDAPRTSRHLARRSRRPRPTSRWASPP